jgi:hypothetical protein
VPDKESAPSMTVGALTFYQALMPERITPRIIWRCARKKMMIIGITMVKDMAIIRGICVL